MKAFNSAWILLGILCLSFYSNTSYSQSLQDNLKAGLKASREKRFSDAEKLLGAALKEAEAQKLDNMTMQFILWGLAVTNRDQRKYEEAGQYYRQLLTVIEKSSETSVELTMRGINGLGNVYLNQKKYAQAEQVFKKSVEAGEKYGKDVPDEIGVALDGLALAYLVQKKYEDAEPIYKRAITHYEKAFGEADETVAGALERYAGLLRRMKRESEAEKLEARARVIRSERAK